MLRWAYPEGLPEVDYLPLLANLHEHMSDRALATAMAHVFRREYSVVFDDITRAALTDRPGPGPIDRVRAKLDLAGFQSWMKDDPPPPSV
jgi:hypothetical protein